MLNSSPHPPICSIRSHCALSAQASTNEIHLSISGFEGAIGDYTTNLGSNTNHKHLFSQSPDTPTFQPVADVLAEIAPPAPARVAAREVYIPARDEHDGMIGVFVTVEWICPVCGGPRGEIVPSRSYDGSRILYCDGWSNPCGHIDKYDDVRAEAVGNG